MTFLRINIIKKESSTGSQLKYTTYPSQFSFYKFDAWKQNRLQSSLNKFQFILNLLQLISLNFHIISVMIYIIEGCTVFSLLSFILKFS